MTSYVISNSQTTTQDLPNQYDDLLVTSPGSIILTTTASNPGGDDGIYATSNDQEITIDGLVYSTNALGNTGVQIAGQLTVLTVNGQVQGDTGVDVNQGTDDRISVGVQGVIDGNGDSVLFEGNFDDPSATDDVLDNAGDISGTVSAAFGGGDEIDNTGQISGNAAVYFSSDVTTETVENSGTITGRGSASASAIVTTGGSAGIDVVNSGLITDGSMNPLGGTSAVLSFSDASGPISTIDNTGSITGAGYVIQSNSDFLDISNSGTILGGLYTTAAVDLDNSGLWKGQAGSAVLVLDLNSADDTVTNSHGTIDGAITILGGGDTISNSGGIDGQISLDGSGDTNSLTNSGEVTGSLTLSGGSNTVDNSGLWQASSGSATAFTLSAADDGITNSKTGTIGGAISIVSGGDTITNAGSIDGPVTFTGSGNTNSLTNSGEITGNVTLSGGFNTVDSPGAIDGTVSFAHSHDTFNNAGTVDGLVSVAAGSDTVTNAGTIDGQVMFWSTGTGNSLTNSGSITGDVTLPGSSAAANHGQIYGNVILGASDTLVNTGTIHGNVTLNSGDTFDVSPGLVTGVINADISDLFEFGGNFGNVTFDDFVPGTSLVHDTIQFAANDFSTFSQVQAASTQQGSDVVIKLDATDSITVSHTALASLVSADFTFV